MDVKTLFNLAFGVSSPVYLTVPIGKQKDADIIYSTKLKEDDLEIYTQGDEKVFSDFGTEVVFPVYFEAGDYKSKKWLPSMKFPQGYNTMSEFRLPNVTMVDFSRPKNSTKTQMAFGVGSVTEIFGFDDWQIRIRMLCIAEKNRGLTGRQIANMVVEWSELLDAIKVRGRLFNDKDIFSLTIDDIDEKNIEGSPDTVAIELSCSSDEPFELIY